MIVKFKKLNKDAKAPFKKNVGDAGFDLTAVRTSFDAHGNLVCHTGLAVEIPEGYVGLVFPRSSCSSMNIIMANCVGVIDSGYRGEITAKFKLLSMDGIYKPGERCCQIIIIPYPKIDFAETDELSSSDRGIGGYGSTGK